MKEKNRLQNLLENTSHHNDNELILSYSRLSDFDKNGPKSLLEKTFIDNQGIKMGSVIDDLLFSQDEFKTKYYISEVNEPTSTLGALCNIITKYYENIPDKEEVLNIIKRNNFWGNVKKADILDAKFNIPEFWIYLDNFYKSKDKILLTPDEKMKADEIVSILGTHPFSKHIFSSEYEHYYQYKFKIPIKQFNFRGIIDIISIDHKNKTVALIDLKTGAGNSNEFITSFIKYKYYFQAAIYQLAFEEICKDLKLEGYILKPFEFLYIGLKEKIPVRFTVSDKWIKSAIEGFNTKSGVHYKGIYELIDEIYFHWYNKLYDVPKEVYEKNGILNLNDNFIE